MASFPLLKTGAVAQYPSDRTIRARARVFRFVDGSEQRFQAFGAPLRQWVIRLELLDESEMVTLREFVQSEEGRSGSFSFTDPWTGTVFSNCSLGADSIRLDFRGSGRGATSLVVKENR